MATTTIYASGSELLNNSSFSLNVFLPNQQLIFITGTLYSPINQVMPNAAIVIKQFDSTFNPPKFLYQGLTFTDYNGVYGISMPYSLNSSYELTAYGS